MTGARIARRLLVRFVEKDLRGIPFVFLASGKGRIETVPSGRMITTVLECTGASGCIGASDGLRRGCRWNPVLSFSFAIWGTQDCRGILRFQPRHGFFPLPIPFRYSWSPFLPLDVVTNNQTDRARHLHDVCVISTFPNKVSIALSKARTDLFSDIPLRFRLLAFGCPRIGGVNSLLAKTCRTHGTRSLSTSYRWNR